MKSKHLLCGIMLAALVGCSARFREEPLMTMPAEETAARELYAQSTIALKGKLVDVSGAPLAGATLRAGTATTTSDTRGAFRFDALPRHNVLLEVASEGYYTGHVAVWLARELEVTEVELDPVALTAHSADRIRLLFGGDTAFGRRYLDPGEDTPLTEVPRDDPMATIRPSAAASMTRDVLAGVRPYFQVVDHASVNLESVVTTSPKTPHPTKAYVYFTLPPSLEALSWLGVDYVSLGNNHVYDYLAAGLEDTLLHVGEAGLQTSGLGATRETAWQPLRLEVEGTPLSMISACSIDGAEHEHAYVAGEDQGGAANLRDTERLTAAVSGERADGRSPIAIWHTGDEYAVAPTSYGRARMELAAEQGAALVVSHHAHVAMGFGEHAGVPIVYGLGNFAFDQDRLETMLGLLAQVDMADGAVVDIQGIPTQLERYRPLPVSGPLADALLRRITELSDNVEAYPYNGRAEVFSPGKALERTIELSVQIPAEGWTIVDLRELRRQGESLAAARGPVSARPGRGLLLHGTMEDYDVDDETMDVAHWDVSSESRFACRVGARRGATGLCSVRDGGKTSDTVIAFRNRVRVWGDYNDQPNKELSLLLWVRGENAGALSGLVRYYASEGDRTFGEELAFQHKGGSFQWTRFVTDLTMPADVAPADPTGNPRALRLFLRHAPPSSGHALAAWDDLAVINWEETLELRDGATLPTPNARDFLRISGAPGEVQLELTFRRRVRF